MRFADKKIKSFNKLFLFPFLFRVLSHHSMESGNKIPSFGALEPENKE